MPKITSRIEPAMMIPGSQVAIMRYTETMILAALVIGAISAYYFGLRIGAIAAIGSALLFALGIVLPNKLFWTYGLVAAYVLVVLVLGPRMPGRQENKADFFRVARKISRRLLQAYRRVRK